MLTCCCYFFEFSLLENFPYWPNYQLQPFSLQIYFMLNYCIVKSSYIFKTSEFHVCRLSDTAVVNFVEQPLKSIEAELNPTVP